MTGKKPSLIISLLLCLFLFTGCGVKDEPAVPEGPRPVQFAAGEIAPDASQISIVLQEGETALLAGLPQLKSADFSGSSCIEEIYNWAQANPQVDVKYTVTLPDGSTADTSTESLDLSAKSGSEVCAYAEVLRFLPDIKTIELGYERPELDWASIDTLQQSLPDSSIKFIFTLYGKEFELQNTQLNLSHVPVDDNGDAVMEAMAYMPNLSYVDMDSCGLSNERMAEIRDAYPHVKVVWRVWFGEGGIYSVRTDVERILASTPSQGEIYPGNSEALQYCTDVKYLDVGHNTNLTDISFVAHMPKLEVAILAMCNWSDASPLANCTELEYLEMQTTQCTDISALSGLTKLRHLNIAYNRDLVDISPLYGLTELERLWIGCVNWVPKEQVAKMQECAPNCEINVEVYEDPTGGRWRYVDYNELAYIYICHDRYILLREQFGEYQSSAFSYWWNDPLY